MSQSRYICRYTRIYLAGSTTPRISGSIRNVSSSLCCPFMLLEVYHTSNASVQCPPFTLGIATARLRNPEVVYVISPICISHPICNLSHIKVKYTLAYYTSQIVVISDPSRLRTGISNYLVTIIFTTDSYKITKKKLSRSLPNFRASLAGLSEVCLYISL